MVQHTSLLDDGDEVANCEESYASQLLSTHFSDRRAGRAVKFEPNSGCTGGHPVRIEAGIPSLGGHVDATWNPPNHWTVTSSQTRI